MYISYNEKLTSHIKARKTLTHVYHDISTKMLYVSVGYDNKKVQPSSPISTDRMIICSILIQ